MTKENKYIKEFRELWNNEMFKLQGKYPPEFCCYMNGVCKRITDKILKSQRKEIIEKVIKEKPFNDLTRDLIERNKIDKYLNEWERRINLIKEDE